MVRGVGASRVHPRACVDVPSNSEACGTRVVVEMAQVKVERLQGTSRVGTIALVARARAQVTRTLN